MKHKKKYGTVRSVSDETENLTFKPAAPSRWKDIEELFGERGACGGCWCMAWRLERKDWLIGKGKKNRRALRMIVKSGESPGIIGYLESKPIGWCAVAPRKVYKYLERSRVLKPIDEEQVWSVSCLFVSKSHRRRGISAKLLWAAAEFAIKSGAKIVEGYPIIPTMKKTPGPFIWTGTPVAFKRAGFREVYRWSQARPIMRFSTLGAE